MKTRMLILFALGAAMIAGFAQSHAQEREARYARYDFNRLMSAFHESLRSDVPGVVESTIYNLVEYKSYFPQREYSNLIRELSDVARAASDPVIAYKASLAELYLLYGSSLGDDSVFSPFDHQPAFRLVSEQLEGKFLLLSSH